VHVPFPLIVLSSAAVTLTAAHLVFRLLEERMIDDWKRAQEFGVDVETRFLQEIARSQSQPQTPACLHRLDGKLLAWRCRRILPRLLPKD
jgi:hypothetical protein